MRKCIVYAAMERCQLGIQCGIKIVPFVFVRYRSVQMLRIDLGFDHFSQSHRTFIYLQEKNQRVRLYISHRVFSRCTAHFVKSDVYTSTADGRYLQCILVIAVNHRYVGA